MPRKRADKSHRNPSKNSLTIGEDMCIWMKARVINFKLCHRDHDCSDCAFDRAMSGAWAEEPGEGEEPSRNT